MTALGLVHLSRPYRIHSDGGCFPADVKLGLDGFLTTQAKRMATLAGVKQPFAKAEGLLEALCGWTVDEETLRRITHEMAKAATKTRDSRSDAERFQQSKGEVEVPIDAGKVNTTGGWRDVKIALFSKRESGSPATPADWDSRVLPKPTIRTVVAAIEDSGEFAKRVQAEADRLNVTHAAAITVLGDGAEWIWNLADAVFPIADGVLDVFHALEHIADALKAVWGDGEVAQLHRDAGRQALLTRGKIGVENWLARVIATVPPGLSTDPLLALAAYLSKHPIRLDYAERLAEGRSIGSGAVEGAVKQWINLRLKRTGARWKADHVGPLVELIALSETPEWAELWVTA
jgi:hypothetical protein